MRAVDTNVLVRILVRDNEQQALLADQFIADGAWVSLIAVVEMAWVLESVYGRDDAAIAASLEMLLNHQQLILQSADAVSAAVELFRAKPALGITDCLMLELARHHGHLPLGTFDRRLGKLEGAKAL